MSDCIVNGEVKVRSLSLLLHEFIACGQMLGSVLFTGFSVGFYDIFHVVFSDFGDAIRKHM